MLMSSVCSLDSKGIILMRWYGENERWLAGWCFNIFSLNGYVFYMINILIAFSVGIIKGEMN